MATTRNAVEGPENPHEVCVLQQTLFTFFLSTSPTFFPNLIYTVAGGNVQEMCSFWITNMDNIRVPPWSEWPFVLLLND